MDYLQQQQQQQQQQSMMIAPHAQPAYVQQQMLAMMNLDYYFTMNNAMVDPYGLHTQQQYNPYGQMMAQGYNSNLVSSEAMSMASTQSQQVALLEPQPIANAVISGQMIACGWQGCDAVFIERRAFDEHFAQAHSVGKPLFCSWEGCHRQFISMDDYMRHVDNHESEQRLAATAMLQNKANFASASQGAFSAENLNQSKPKKRSRLSATDLVESTSTTNLQIGNNNMFAQTAPASSTLSSGTTAIAVKSKSPSSDQIQEEDDHAESARVWKKKKSSRTPPSIWSSDAEDHTERKKEYKNEQHAMHPVDRNSNAYGKKVDGETASRKLKLPSMASPGSYKGGGMQKKTLAQATVQKPTKKYCLCEATEDGKFMVQCDTCSDWYHPNCVGMTKKEARWVTKFVCPICLSKKISQPAQRPSSSRTSDSESSSESKLESESAGTELEANKLREEKPFGVSKETGTPYLKGRHPRKAVPVEQCSTTGESIQIHKSMSQAARAVGVTYTGRINTACNSWLQEAHGFCWRYPSDEAVAIWDSACQIEVLENEKEKEKVADAATAAASAVAVGDALQLSATSTLQTQERNGGSKRPTARAAARVDSRVDSKGDTNSAGPAGVSEDCNHDLNVLSPRALDNAVQQQQTRTAKPNSHTQALGKNVEQLCLDTGRILAKFCSQREAARSCDGRQSAISMVCRGVKPYAHGFFWRFKGSLAMPQGLSAHARDVGGVGGASAANANAADVELATALRKGEPRRSSSALRCGGNVDTNSGGSNTPSSAVNGLSRHSQRMLSKKTSSSNGSRASSTPIEQLCIASGKVLNRFASQFDAARHLKIGYSASIFATCVGKQNNAHGFSWRFAESKVWSRMRDAKAKPVKVPPKQRGRAVEADHSTAEFGSRRGKGDADVDGYPLDNEICHRNNEDLDEVDEMDFFSSRTYD